MLLPRKPRVVSSTLFRKSSDPPNVRDESSKTIITEDDVRDLPDGAVLRIGEGARLTPLAADIVSQKRSRLFAACRGADQKRRG